MWNVDSLGFESLSPTSIGNNILFFGETLSFCCLLDPMAPELPGYYNVWRLETSEVSFEVLEWESSSFSPNVSLIFIS